MSRVLIVEDESAIAHLLALNLRHAGHEPILAADAAQAAAALQVQTPDVILLDWMLPGMSGVELARLWRTDGRLRQVPIIMLTARAAEADKVRGLDAGVDDYLTKPFSMPELLARIRAALRRRQPQPNSQLLRAGPLHLDAAAQRVSMNNQPVALGPTEYRLLHYFMANAQRVHSRATLIERVWDGSASMEERTVDVWVKRLRAALAPWGCENAIETVRGTGYRFSAGFASDQCSPSEPSGS